MEKNEILEALKEVNANSPKRKFKQSYDLIATFKGLDLKKPDNQVDVFVQLHYPKGKKVKVCGLVGPELKDAASEACDFVIAADDFDKYAKDKKATKKLGRDYDFFIAQANIMPKVAQAFGRILGPKGKMPNPKAGCVVPPNANLKPLIEKLQKTVRVSVKLGPVFQCRIGSEDSKDEELADTMMTIYNALIHALPNEQHNIKNIMIKKTMGPPTKIGKKTQEKVGPKELDKKEKKSINKKAKE